jgi:anti-sigma regulatory factor (Ser/Thr protein kinase)
MLSKLDDWERNEQDPDVLDRLFVLDQLATRMRRTVDSLFVIAGVQGTASRQESSTVDDVVGAALSEIEQFNRVRRRFAGRVRVARWAVIDLAHLLAELFDNATRFTSAFSSPDVDLVFRPDRDGLVIVIGDHGVGMKPDEIERANAFMSAQAVDLIFSSMRTMGLLVVALLAARHGITVRFRPRPTPKCGLIVEVHLPTEIVTGTQGAREIDSPHRPMIVRSAESTPPHLSSPAAHAPRRAPAHPVVNVDHDVTGDTGGRADSELFDDDGPRHAELHTYTAEELQAIRERMNLPGNLSLASAHQRRTSH